MSQERTDRGSWGRAAAATRLLPPAQALPLVRLRAAVDPNWKVALVHPLVQMGRRAEAEGLAVLMRQRPPGGWAPVLLAAVLGDGPAAADALRHRADDGQPFYRQGDRTLHSSPELLTIHDIRRGARPQRHASEGGTVSARSPAPDRAALVARLAALATSEPVPRDEWEWLAVHGTLETFEAGTLLAPPGLRIDKLFILLSGHIATYVDRGGGLRLVTEWRTGEVTGRLPYSRMGTTIRERTTRTEAATEAVTIHERDFAAMAHRCPVFTAWCVHVMVDRARTFSASDLQDEKMVSLGKLAAGLAHELNNPASAAVRAATQLLAGLAEAESAARALGAAGASPEILDALDRVRTACMATAGGTVPSSLQRADREDAIAVWLARRRLDASLTVPLADTAATTESLDALAASVPEDLLEAAARWIAAGCATHALATEIRDAAARIADLVAAVKRFTYMDTVSGSESVAVEPGLRDTLRVLASKARKRGVGVALSVEPALPPVRATGSELNQVWMNLVDNALDAAPEAGTVTVDARRELDHVAVRVSDDGQGIPADVVPRIFDAFFTTKPPGQGTGLGLEIARRLVRRYRGEITVESRPGRTTFCVRLPLSAPAA